MRILCMLVFFLAFMEAKDSLENIKSMQAEFKQQVKGERGAIPVVYEGIMYAMDNKIRWHYNKPLNKDVYLEDNVAYIYEPQLNQVTIGSLKENVDFIKILKRVKKIKGKADLYETTIDNVKYVLSMRDNKPYTLSYKDELDNQVVILFSNVEMNKYINQDTFVFIPPKDVEYIEAN